MKVENDSSDQIRPIHYQCDLLENSHNEIRYYSFVVIQQ